MTDARRLELYQEYPEPGEEELAHSLAQFMQSVVVDKEYLTGTTYRDVHAKGVATLKAELIVESDVPAELRHGVFREPRRYPAWVRVSNSSQSPSPDHDKDIRGFALKLMDVPGEKLLAPQAHADTQDFLFLTTDVFLTSNTREFYDFIVAFNTSFRASLGFAIRHPEIAWKLLLALRRYGNLLDRQYFSATPFRLGELAVKHSLRPVIARRSSIPDDPANNYLRDRIAAQLAREEVCFDFLVQVQRDPYRQPIEDALVSWSQKISPFRKVATLRIPRQRVDTPERNQIGENLAMNVWHALPDHRPLGNVNRARRIVYFEIARFRHERNLAPLEEPTAGPEFLDS
jgi:Catalase